jgi:hypothetical protein
MDLGRADDEPTANSDFVAAQRTDLGDYFSFDIARTALLDDADVAGAVRFRVRASLAGRRFEEYVVDVGFSDAVDRPDDVVGPDLLAFADLPPIRVPTLPLPLHIAEKVHAYTRRYGPNQRPSTRVKDLIDLVLITMETSCGAGDLKAALRQIFTARATHSLPNALPEPSAEWVAPYRRLAQARSLPTDSREGHRIVAAFLNPILADLLGEDSHWDPSAGAWLAQRS